MEMIKHDYYKVKHGLLYRPDLAGKIGRFVGSSGGNICEIDFEGVERYCLFYPHELSHIGKSAKEETAHE